MSPQHAAGAVGFVIETLAYGLLAIVLAAGWSRARAQGAAAWLLIIAALFETLYATGAVLALNDALPERLASGLDVLRLAVWVSFLGFLVGGGAGPLAVAATLIAAAGAALAAPTLVSGGDAAGVAQAGITAGLAVAGLMLLERIFFGASKVQRWSLKHLCLGLGLSFAFDFFVAADLLVLGVVRPGVAEAKGYVHALAVPFVAISVSRAACWGFPAQVSHRFARRSFALLLSGLYLLVAASVSEEVGRQWGELGPLIQVLLLSVALAVLAAALASTQARALLQDFLSRHFFSFRHDYREVWSRFMTALEGDAGDRNRSLPERAALALAETVGAGGAVVWRHDGGGRFEPLASRHVDAAQVGSGSAPDLLEAWRVPDGAVDLPNAQAASRWLKPWMPPPAVAWLLLPLHHRGALFGFVMLTRPAVRKRLLSEDRDLLRLVGQAVTSYLAEDEAVRRLAEARQFEAFNRRFAYVMHDVKNLAAQLSLTLTNARRHRGNPEFYEDMLATLEGSNRRMNKLIAQMRSKQDSALEPVNLAEVVKRAAGGRAGPKPQLGGKLPKVMVRADAVKLESVLAHLIDNAFEAGGRVKIGLDAHDGMAVVQIEDDGPGMSGSFVRERLFKPFVSTKPTGMGLGLAEARDVVAGLGGRLEVDSEEGRGTTMRICLPQLREWAL